MTLGRVTRCALLIVPLFVCAGRLHAQHSAPPAGLLQEVNRCLSLVRATSRRRYEQERSQKLGVGGAVATDNGAAVSDGHRLAAPVA
jgi:hypothetical protein